MKRMTSVLALCAFALCLSVAVFAQGTPAAPSTPSTTDKATSAPAATPAKAHSHHMSAPKMPPVDINSASKEDLMKLNGVDDATAEKIIAARPFKMKSELKSKGILTQAQYTKVSTKVVAKQSK